MFFMRDYTKGILVFGYRKAMPAKSTHPLASIKPENQSVSSIFLVACLVRICIIEKM